MEPVLLVIDSVQNQLKSSHEAEPVDQVDDDGVGVAGFFHVDGVVASFGEESRDCVELLGDTLVIYELVGDHLVVGVVYQIFALGRAGLRVELLGHGAGFSDSETRGDEIDIVRLAPPPIDSTFRVLLPDSSLLDHGFLLTLFLGLPEFPESYFQADVAASIILLNLSSA